MTTNRLFINRMRGYFSREKARKSQPIPVGFMVCPAVVISGVAPAQLQAIQQVYQHAYEAARRNVIPFYLRPVLGTGN